MPGPTLKGGFPYVQDSGTRRALHTLLARIAALEGGGSAGGERIWVDGWYEPLTTANETDQVMTRYLDDLDATAFFPVLFDCYVSFLGIDCHDGPEAGGGPSAGTVTIHVWKNSVTQLTDLSLVLTAPAPYAVLENADPGLLVLAPGDHIQLRRTTSSDWDPDTTKILGLIALTRL